jgi:hypothetical protein
VDQQDQPAGDGDPALRLEQLAGKVAGHRRVAEPGEQHRHHQEADRGEAAPPEGSQHQRNAVFHRRLNGLGAQM